MSKIPGILLVLGLGLPCQADDLFGRVVRVTAGDHLEVKRQGRFEPIQVYGVECPHGPRGVEAKLFTLQLAQSRGVSLRTLGKDSQGRTVAQVSFVGGQNLSEELVRAGMAHWAKSKVPHDKRLARLEAEARAARRGLWADPVKNAPPSIHARHSSKHHTASSEHKLAQR